MISIQLKITTKFYILNKKYYQNDIMKLFIINQAYFQYIYTF